MAKTLLLAALCAAALVAQTPTLGIFEAHADIGTVLHAGSASYDSKSQTYTIAGSGANMWAAEDDFQFVWKKVSGVLC